MGAVTRPARFPRAPLFVPAHVDRLTDKALQLAVEALVLDLEDAVPPGQKALARERAAALIGRRPGFSYVRINAVAPRRPGFASPLGEDDLAAVLVPGLRGIVLPKTESARDVIVVDAQLRALERLRGLEPGSVQLLGLVESARGVAQLGDIVQAAVSRPWCLCYGAGDYTADIGAGWTDLETESQTARSLLVMASASAGLPPPIDSAFPNVEDSQAFRASARNAQVLGFHGKFAIHPSQVAVVQAVFRPTPEQVDWAQRVLEALAAAEAEGRGAFMVDGRMVDYPIVERARRIMLES